MQFDNPFEHFCPLLARASKHQGEAFTQLHTVPKNSKSFFWSCVDMAKWSCSFVELDPVLFLSKETWDGWLHLEQCLELSNDNITLWSGAWVQIYQLSGVCVRIDEILHHTTPVLATLMDKQAFDICLETSSMKKDNACNGMFAWSNCAPSPFAFQTLSSLQLAIVPILSYTVRGSQSLVTQNLSRLCSANNKW